MLAALARDFVRAGCRVTVLRDARLPEPGLTGVDIQLVSGPGHELARCLEIAAASDYTVLIAPELDRLLWKRCCAVREVGRLLSPDAAFVELASSKHRTACRLSAAGVPVPDGVLVSGESPWPAAIDVPAVWKRDDGAGSTDTHVLLERIVPSAPQPMRLERFCEGTAASVSVLCGPAGNRLLPPCFQRLSQDGRLRYLGGRVPLPPLLSSRASQLAQRALDALPPAMGYVGIDLVLGQDDVGREDVVIEVNPRLTTSYLGLRELARENLALAMWDVAEGRQPALSFRDDTVEFGPRTR